MRRILRWFLFSMIPVMAGVAVHQAYEDQLERNWVRLEARVGLGEGGHLMRTLESAEAHFKMEDFQTTLSCSREIEQHPSSPCLPQVRKRAEELGQASFAKLSLAQAAECARNGNHQMALVQVEKILYDPAYHQSAGEARSLHQKLLAGIAQAELSRARQFFEDGDFARAREIALENQNDPHIGQACLQLLLEIKTTLAQRRLEEARAELESGNLPKARELAQALIHDPLTGLLAGKLLEEVDDAQDRQALAVAEDLGQYARWQEAIQILIGLEQSAYVGERAKALRQKLGLQAEQAMLEVARGLLTSMDGTQKREGLQWLSQLKNSSYPEVAAESAKLLESFMPSQAEPDLEQELMDKRRAELAQFVQRHYGLSAKPPGERSYPDFYAPRVEFLGRAGMTIDAIKEQDLGYAESCLERHYQVESSQIEFFRGGEAALVRSKVAFQLRDSHQEKRGQFDGVLEVFWDQGGMPKIYRETQENRRDTYMRVVGEESYVHLIAEFAKDYIELGNQRRDQSEFFSNQVDYFGEGTLSVDQIAKSCREYWDKYLFTRDELESQPEVVALGGGEWESRHEQTTSWRRDLQDEVSFQRGTLKIRWRREQEDGDPRIVSIQFEKSGSPLMSPASERRPPAECSPSGGTPAKKPVKGKPSAVKKVSGTRTRR